MNSVRITCICDGIRISDLGVSLKKGDSIVVSIDKARKSKDLKLAVRAGGVSQLPLKGPQKVLPRKATKARFERKPVVKASIAKTPTEAELLREMLSQTLANHQDYVVQMTEQIAFSLRELNTSNPIPTTANIDISSIEAIVKSALSGVTAMPSASGVVGNLGTVGDSGPMFIPEGIVVEDSLKDIGASEDSSGFSVDEATEALRAMKKKKTKNKNKGG